MFVFHVEKSFFTMGFGVFTTLAEVKRTERVREPMYKEIKIQKPS